jgi:hypothetical protein
MCPQRVEATVVPDAVRGVPFDPVSSEIAQFGPSIETSRCGGDHLGDSVAPLVERLAQRGPKTLRQFRIDRRQHRRRESGGEVDRLVAHVTGS